MPDCARREAPMNEEVKFIRGNDGINRLAQRPGIAAEVAVTLAAAVPYRVPHLAIAFDLRLCGWPLMVMLPIRTRGSARRASCDVGSAPSPGPRPGLGYCRRSPVAAGSWPGAGDAGYSARRTRPGPPAGAAAR